MAELYGRNDFARVLNDARLEHHLSVREAARIAGIPYGTLQGWLSGRHFPVPALRANCVRLLEVLDLADSFAPDFWSGSPTASSDPRGDVNAPFLGLRPFGADDTELFHGRTAEVGRLIEAVRVAMPHGIVVVVGASGSGKSSLLAAGLIPATRAEQGPLAERSSAMVHPADLASGTTDTDLVVVDQFDDIFAESTETRERVFELLARQAERSVVVIALRSDAFALAAAVPNLSAALAHPFLVAPLSQSELGEAITGPAAARGVRVEAELVRILLDEVGSNVGNASAMLPLLSSSLLATWAVGRGSTMTVADYYVAGGLAGAVDRHAEGVYAMLEVERQARARQLFLRLIRFADDVPLRRPISSADLDILDREIAALFVNARILTVADGAVRISHEALLEHWARLRGWVDAQRADLESLSRLRRATVVWVDSGRDPAALIPLNRLETVADWIDEPQRRELLAPDESEYVEASAAHFTSVLAKEQQQTRSLRRQRRALTASLALVSVLALVVGLLSVQTQRNADEARNQRNIAQSRQVAMAAETSRSQDSNLQAQMALVSSRLAATQEGESALLDATSVDVPTRWLGAATSALGVAADGSVIVRANGDGSATWWRGDEVSSTPGHRFSVVETPTPIYSVAVARVRGRVLAAFGGPEVCSIWDIDSEPTLMNRLDCAGVTVYALRFEPDHGRLAMGTSDGKIQVVDVGNPTPTLLHTMELDDGSPVSSLAWGPTGLLVAGGAASGVARWRVGARISRLPALPTVVGGVAMRVLGLAVNGSQLVAGLRGSAMLRWKLDGDHAVESAPVTTFKSWVNDVAFASDGRTIVAGSSDQSVRVIDAASGEVQRDLAGPSIVTGVAIVDGRPVSASTDGALRVWAQVSPLLRTGTTPVYNVSSDADANWLAAGTAGNGIALWGLATGKKAQVEPPDLRPGDAQTGAVAVASSGQFMLGGTQGGSLLSWRLANGRASFVGQVEGLGGAAAYVTISPGTSLAAAIAYGGASTGVYRMSDDGTAVLSATLETPGPQLAAFSRDSRLLAIALANNSVAIYSTEDPSRPRKVATLSGFTTAPISLAFSPTEDLLAVGEDSGLVTLWSTSDVAQPVKDTELGDAHASAYGLAFTPDGRRLAAATADGQVWGWQIGDQKDSIWSLTTQVGRPWDVRFFEAGERLVVAGDDGRLQTWDVDPTEAAAKICSSRGNELTATEWARYLPSITEFDPC